MLSELPLCLFTVFGGAAAGLYLAQACFPKLADEKRPWLVALVALILLLVSAVALMFHLGRPAYAYLAFRNPASGIAQEGYAAIAFGVFVAIDFIYSWVKKSNLNILRIVCAVLGFVLVLVMGGAYYAYTAVAAMHSPLTFIFFVLCAVGLGASLFGVLPSAVAFKSDKLTKVIAITGIVAAAMILIEGIYYMVCGAGIALFVVGAVCAAIGGVCALYVKKSPSCMPWLVLIAMFLGVFISRLGFYAVF